MSLKFTKETGQDVDVHNSIAYHISEVLQKCGVDIEEEHFRETPERWAAYVREYFKPFTVEDILGPKFQADNIHSMVAQSNIPMSGMCPHHLLPYLGHASIGYIPRHRIIGLSKMARLVNAVTHEMPRIQEEACEYIANCLDEYIEPIGVIVVMRAMHTCMGARGVRMPDVPTSTSALRGVFRDVPSARQEFFTLVGSQNS